MIVKECCFSEMIKNGLVFICADIPELSPLHKYVPDLGDDDVFMVS